MAAVMTPSREFRGRNFLRLADYTKGELLTLLSLAKDLKRRQKAGESHRLLEGKCLAMIFEKPSSRTRISFEVGMFQLGGNAINVNAAEIKMGQRESIADVARTLSRYVDAVLIRAYYHWTIEEFAQHATVPVINGLSDHSHPCQAMADVLTMEEHCGALGSLKVCYVGDGNNVCNSLIEASAALEIPLTVSCPAGHDPLVKALPSWVSLVRNPAQAVRGADVVYTDVWVSMGQEGEGAHKTRAFLDYAVTPALMDAAKPGAIFMHCLPAHRGLEVDEAVLESKQSVVFDQAENRLHAQKAILAHLVGGVEGRS